ncbi:hypothetical protein N7490_003018 [Penicillium lividum]|nr:hypothetical protein N7490_003018 [Penicillium lividum]
MNISGSLSIKTATIGGKANGSYVDSDKFKSSDINFHLQVKVTNQVVEPGNYCIFNKIPQISKEKFNEIYGDTFISGWESGGELNAIISMKIADKSKVFNIKASLEAELNTPSVSGSVKGDFEKTKNEITSNTETTIAVNWSGGGRIKDPTEDWSISSLKKAAAAFPDLVAITPQRTYAILTKYTALESFHLQNRGFSPLEYENAGVYTASLLDNYMDYKSLWKQISFASYELESNRATIELAQPSQDVYDLAKIKGPLASVKKSVQRLLEGSTKESLALAKKKEEVEAAALSNQTETAKPFEFLPASFAGLIKARQMCRIEMAKIVNEVDAVAEDPMVAADATRDLHFLNPLVFKQLVPVVRSLSAENAVLGVKDPSATIILGYSPPAHENSIVIPVYKFNVSIDKQDHRLQASIKKCAAKSEDYRVHGTAGEVEQVHENATMFNALERLDSTFRPRTIAVWAQDNTVQGIKIFYGENEVMAFGACDEKAGATQTLQLKDDGSEAIVEINIKTGVDKAGDKYIAAIELATSACKTLNTFAGKEEDEANLQTVRYVRYDDQPWSLRGFFGFIHENRLISLGVVWGKDSFVPVPNVVLAQPLCRNLLGMSDAMQKDVLGHMARLHNRSKFLMSDFVYTGIRSEKTVIFNALSKVESTWTIAKLGFATANSGQGKDRLSGLKVFYTNGKSLAYGAYPEKDEEAAWVCDVNSPIVTAKLVTTKPTGDNQLKPQKSFINSVEFVLAADNLGQLPGWPLDVSTVRFLSDAEDQSASDLPALVESAPKPGRSIWSMKGFYGEYTDGLITQLGIVWGRS